MRTDCRPDPAACGSVEIRKAIRFFAHLPAVLLSFVSIPLHAELPRDNPMPGGVAVIPLKVPSAEKPVVHFGELKVHVAEHGDGWQAHVGLPCDILPGRYIITVTGNAGNSSIIEFGVVPRFERVALPVESNGQDNLQSPGSVSPVAERISNRVISNPMMSRRFATDYTMLETIETDFSFHAPVESIRTVEYGRLLNDGNLHCHDYLSFFPSHDSSVYAPSSGLVIGVEQDDINRHTIVLAHAPAILSILGNLVSTRVKAGQLIRQGELLGTAGPDVNGTSGRIDWAITLNGYRVDPLQFTSRP